MNYIKSSKIATQPAEQPEANSSSIIQTYVTVLIGILIILYFFF